MQAYRVVKRISVFCMVSVLVIACLHQLWLAGAFLPSWVTWGSGRFHDGTGSYEIVLSRRSVHILSGDAVIWSSPESVKVQDVLSCDIDHDGEEELILLCWKVGRYGKYKPFWIEQDERKWSQHIFVYEYQQGEIKPKWMSSYIGQDVADITVSGGGTAANRLLLTGPEGKTSSYIWDSWGFVKEDTEVAFAAFGDNLIHEPIYRYGLHHDESFGFLFENMEKVISESDVAIINQETPLVGHPALYGDYPRFGTPVQVGQAIVNAGFDVVTCATNHALDRDAYGIETTKDFFESNQIICLGIQTGEEEDDTPYELMVKKGIRFALLNYTYGTNGMKIPDADTDMVHVLDDEEKVRKDIQQARAEADFVILFVHWGTENSSEIDDFQRKWAQVFLEGKVDVVIGTHPHVLQPVEVLKSDEGHEMLIYYSLGNFISVQSEKESIRGGMASFTVSLTPKGYAVTEYVLQPLMIKWQEGGRYTVEQVRQ